MQKAQYTIGHVTNETQFLFINGLLGRIGIEFQEVNSNVEFGLVQTWLKKKEPQILSEKEFNSDEFKVWLNQIAFPSSKKQFIKKHSTTTFSKKRWSKKEFINFLKECEISLRNGVSCQLDIVGIGYKGEIQEEKLILSAGRSHPVKFIIPKGLAVQIPKGHKDQKIVIFGLNLEEVKNFGAQIRSVLPPERYKGKGIRWSNETIHLKEGKK